MTALRVSLQCTTCFHILFRCDGGNYHTISEKTIAPTSTKEEKRENNCSGIYQTRKERKLCLSVSFKNNGYWLSLCVCDVMYVKNMRLYDRSFFYTTGEYNELCISTNGSM